MQQELIEMLEEIIQYVEVWNAHDQSVLDKAEALIEKAKNNAPAVPQEPLDITEADVWHEGSKSFYRAKLLRRLTPGEAFSEPPEVGYQPSSQEPVTLTDRQFDLICQAIDKADTITMEGDYMLDSDDCISVVRVMQALFDIAALRAKGNKL